MKHPHRCETCKNGMLYTQPKTKVTEHVCSKSPYNSHLLETLWAYVEKKGCEQWLDKDGNPAKKKDLSAVVLQPLKKPQPTTVITTPTHQVTIEVDQHGKL